VTNPLAGHGVYAEGNMDNILEMISVNISKSPEVIENIFIREKCSQEEIVQYMTLFKEFQDVFSWYYEEIPDINP
jgi:hypothetical protein